MVLGSYTKHPGLTFRAKRILARHTALVRYQGLALGADTFPAATHGVLLFMFGHILDFLMNKYSSLFIISFFWRVYNSYRHVGLEQRWHY
jgi:hypothetical protein